MASSGSSSTDSASTINLGDPSNQFESSISVALASIPLSLTMLSNFDIRMAYWAGVPSSKGFAGRALAATLCASCCVCSHVNASWGPWRLDACHGVLSTRSLDGVGPLLAAARRVGGVFRPEVVLALGVGVGAGVGVGVGVALAACAAFLAAFFLPH